MLRGGLRPWSQTMVSEGARPWGRGRSGDCDKRVLKSCVGFACCTIRHENITYPKKLFSNYFPITVSRFRFLQINLRKLPDTYCICVSCATLPGWDPVLVELFFISVTQFEFFRINWVMFSWQMVIQRRGRGTRTGPLASWSLRCCFI